MYGDAVAAGAKNLYFETSGTVRVTAASPDALPKAVARIRQIGIDHVLFGADGRDLGGLELRDVWPELRLKVPLTPVELDAIANNVAPFLR